MIPENQMKLVLLEEFKKAYRYQNFYYESCETLSSLIKRAIDYYQSKGLEVPDRRELYALVEGLDSVVQKHDEFAKTILPDETLQGDEHRRFRRGLDRASRPVL
jgi:hypothetical protein